MISKTNNVFQSIRDTSDTSGTEGTCLHEFWTSGILIIASFISTSISLQLMGQIVIYIYIYMKIVYLRRDLATEFLL